MASNRRLSARRELRYAPQGNSAFTTEQEKFVPALSPTTAGSNLIPSPALCPRKSYASFSRSARLGNARGWIAIPFVLAPMPHQHTTELLDGSDQIDSPPDTTKSPTLRMPGSSPLVRS
jgi:hypothetical protein